MEDDAVLSEDVAKEMCKDVLYVHLTKLKRDQRYYYYFRAFVGRDEDDQLIRRYFPLTRNGFNRAFQASKNYREISEAEAARRAGRTIAQKREDDLEVNGGNCSQERDFAISLSPLFAATNIEYFILNDFTRSDAAFKFPHEEDFLPNQIKTVRTYMRGTRTMQFKNCSGYGEILLLCWNIEEDKGVILKGNLIRNNTLSFTFETVQRKTYFVSLVDRTTIVDVIRNQLTNVNLPRFSKVYLMWQLKSESHIKEMICNQYMISVNGFTFPADQNSEVDLIHPSNEQRDQLKMASKESNKNGLSFNLYTTDGKVE